EIAPRYDERGEALLSHAAPVIDRRQRFPRIRSKRRRLVPTDPGHRKIVLPLWKAAKLPRCGPRAPRRIGELRDRLVEGERVAVSGERMLPEHRVPIPPAT